MSQLKKIAIVCNSTNPDMKLYFKNKVDMKLQGVTYYAQASMAKELGLKPSCFSKSPRPSLLFVVDCLYSIYFCFYLLFKRTKLIVFDTAHICNLPLAVLAKILRIKLVFTIHDWEPHEGKQQKVVHLYNQLVKKVLADEFIVFSDVDSDKPVHKLNLGGFNANFSVTNEGYYLFFGRIEPYKGLQYLMPITCAVQERLKDFNLVVAGKGQHSALKDLQNKQGVKVINHYIYEQELHELISQCKAVLLPYDSATQSGVVVQAYSYGKPVVAFDVGGLSQYIEHGRTGVLVSYPSTDDFAQAIIEIDNNLPHFYQSVSEVFSQKYSVEAFQRRFEEVVRTLRAR